MRRNISLNESNQFDNECIICLKKFDNNKVYLNCNHYFHKKCIEEWKKKSNTCPICRSRISQIREVLTAKKLISKILSIFLCIIILLFIFKLLLIILGNIILPILSKIFSVPIHFLNNFVKSLFDIIYLIVIIALKICKNIILKLLSFVKYIFKNFGVLLDQINKFMNIIKKKLEKINNDL